MTIKRRLLISNIVMISVPTILIFISIYLISLVYYGNYIDRNAFFEVYKLNNVTVSEWQIIVSETCQAVANSNGDIEASERKHFINRLLSDTETEISVVLSDASAKGEILYESQGFASKNMSTIIDDVLKTDNNIKYYFSSAISFSIIDLELRNGSSVTLKIANSRPNFVSTENLTYGRLPFMSDKIRKQFSFLSIIGMFFIFVTNGIIVYMVSRSIMKPLHFLSEGTKKIKEGNYDFVMKYDINDEIGQVCADFDDMRLKLKESSTIKQRYEKNRKELIAGISHDLNTPLTSIEGYVMGLKDGIANTKEKQDKYFDIIYNTAYSMHILVDQLFVFSKLDLNGVPFHFERTNISEYLRDCFEEQKIELENMDLEYINVCEHDIYVNIDKMQFRRVILNIIENSVKYKNKDKGKITISLFKEAKNIVIKLQDNGTGVEEEHLDMLFESFYRTDPSRNNSQKGSGLGLAIAKQIVEKSNGSIYAKSEYGKWFAVFITLPAVL